MNKKTNITLIFLLYIKKIFYFIDFNDMLFQLFLFILSKVASGKFKITYVAYIRFYYTVLNY